MSDLADPMTVIVTDGTREADASVLRARHEAQAALAPPASEAKEKKEENSSGGLV